MTGRSLVPIDHTAPTEVALPDPLIQAMKAFKAKALAARTRQAYARAWMLFAAWCQANGREALPASPETVGAWITALASETNTAGRPRYSRATISLYLAAVVVAHRHARHTLDRKHPDIAGVWKGISNAKATAETERQAKPVLADELKELLRGLRATIPADARDGALLALGWGAALRRSELVGLDWMKQGDGTGFVTIEPERGIVVTLAKSKAAQDKAVTVVVPCTDMPAACFWLEAWAKVAKLAPGQPVFRAVDQRQVIAGERLTDRSVSRIIKARVRELAMLRGKSRAEAAELVERFSGHSLRAGYATSAARANMPGYRIQAHTRHKSAEMVARYVREADKWTNGGLKGVGF
jgi:integrase